MFEILWKMLYLYSSKFSQVKYFVLGYVSKAHPQKSTERQWQMQELWLQGHHRDSFKAHHHKPMKAQEQKLR